MNSEQRKIQLFSRSPFLELIGLGTVCTCQGCLNWPNHPPHLQDLIGYGETLTDPRIRIRHLPVSMLPPSVLEISKVIVVGRNVKDACDSFYHHESCSSITHGTNLRLLMIMQSIIWKEGKVQVKIIGLI